MADQNPFRVIIWCVPRTISTAILKCLSFQPNTKAWMEPYCMAFFSELGVRRMGIQLPRRVQDFDTEAFAAAVAARVKGTPMENAFDQSKTDMSLFLRDSARLQLDALPSDKSVVVKDMAYAVTGYLDMLPSKESGFKHVFLIRNPERMFPSWRRLLMMQLSKEMGMVAKPIDDATFDMTTDVPFMPPGYTYKCQYDLLKHVKETIDPNPVVIDCDELLTNPAVLLPKLCEATGMPYDDKLLEWDASPDISKTWRTLYPVVDANGPRPTYTGALNSSSFQPSKPAIPRSEMKPDVVKCIDATMDYYNEMAKSRILTN